jgi:hypothetical protein
MDTVLPRALLLDRLIAAQAACSVALKNIDQCSEKNMHETLHYKKDTDFGRSLS